MERVERIEAMESALNSAQEAVEQLQEAVASMVDALDALRQVGDYYGSQAWYKDRQADERGTLPADLPRGILSEDLPYEMLVGAREAALGTLEVATAMLRSL